MTEIDYYSGVGREIYGLMAPFVETSLKMFIFSLPLYKDGREAVLVFP
jgi:hypothetical protein